MRTWKKVLAPVDSFDLLTRNPVSLTIPSHFLVGWVKRSTTKHDDLRLYILDFSSNLKSIKLEILDFPPSGKVLPGHPTERGSASRTFLQQIPRL